MKSNILKQGSGNLRYLAEIREGVVIVFKVALYGMPIFPIEVDLYLNSSFLLQGSRVYEEALLFLIQSKR